MLEYIEMIPRPFQLPRSAFPSAAPSRPSSKMRKLGFPHAHLAHLFPVPVPARPASTMPEVVRAKARFLAAFPSRPANLVFLGRYPPRETSNVPKLLTTPP